MSSIKYVFPIFVKQHISIKFVQRARDEDKVNESEKSWKQSDAGKCPGKAGESVREDQVSRGLQNDSLNTCNDFKSALGKKKTFIQRV